MNVTRRSFLQAGAAIAATSRILTGSRVYRLAHPRNTFRLHGCADGSHPGRAE